MPIAIPMKNRPSFNVRNAEPASLVLNNLGSAPFSIKAKRSLFLVVTYKYHDPKTSAKNANGTKISTCVIFGFNV